jgi:hypothetical protein
MTIWRVYVEIGAGTSPPDAAEVLDVMTGQLSDYSAAAGLEDNGNVSAQLTLEARTAAAAIDRGMRAVLEAARAGGVDQPEVVGVQLLTDAEYERRLLRPVVPKLASMQDIANILGFTKQRAQRVVADHAEHFPVVDETAAGKLWLWDGVVRFNETWDRRRTGRPPKSHQDRVDGLTDAVRGYAEDEGLALGETHADEVLTLVLDGVRVDLDERDGGPVVVTDQATGGELKRFTDQPPTPTVLIAALRKARQARAAA